MPVFMILSNDATFLWLKLVSAAALPPNQRPPQPINQLKPFRRIITRNYIQTHTDEFSSCFHAKVVKVQNNSEGL